jgi:hypothetical protein
VPLRNGLSKPHTPLIFQLAVVSNGFLDSAVISFEGYVMFNDAPRDIFPSSNKTGIWINDAVIYQGKPYSAN